MSVHRDSPYSGTIYVSDAYKGTVTKSLCKEFFEVPNRHSNKISIVVKASKGAEILLFDESQSEKWALKITLGSDKTSTSTIGLNTRDAEQETAYPTRDFQTTNILNGSHFKAFVVQWNYGVFKVFDDGGDGNDPLLTWKGPSDMRIGNFGVRTMGSSGVWRVQGGPEFNTTETNDIGASYTLNKVNSGRLEFEIRANTDAYVVLSKEPSDDVPTGLIHLILGGWSNNRNAIYQSLGEVAFYAQTATFSNYEYRRFWAEWDAYSIRFGELGTVVPRMAYRSPTPISQLSYFGFITAGGQKAYYRVLNDGSDSNSISATIGSF